MGAPIHARRRLAAAIVAAWAGLAWTGALAASPSPAATPRPSPPSPSPSPPGPNPDPTHHDSIAPGYWFAILPAPATPVPSQAPAGRRLRWPIQGPISQPFGCTGFGLEPTTGACPAGYHYGIDIAVPAGLPVRAAHDGLAYPLPDYEIYGNHVLISGSGGVGTVYAHLQSMTVAWGQPVKAGDVIGYVGSTGNSTGPHVHFEVRQAGDPEDPMAYLEGTPPAPPLPFGYPGNAARDDGLGQH